MSRVEDYIIILFSSFFVLFCFRLLSSQNIHQVVKLKSLMTFTIENQLAKKIWTQNNVK
jgi:hypothetical protein